MPVMDWESMGFMIPLMLPLLLLVPPLGLRLVARVVRIWICAIPLIKPTLSGGKEREAASLALALSGP